MLSCSTNMHRCSSSSTHNLIDPNNCCCFYVHMCSCMYMCIIQGYLIVFYVLFSLKTMFVLPQHICVFVCKLNCVQFQISTYLNCYIFYEAVNEFIFLPMIFILINLERNSKLFYLHKIQPFKTCFFGYKKNIALYQKLVFIYKS